MSIFQRLFQGHNVITRQALEEALDKVEKDRRRSRREVRRWGRKRKQLVDRMKKMQSEGNDLEVDYLWDEFKEHRRLGQDIKREGRLFNIEGIALKRTIKALDRLERRKDHSSSHKLLERLRSSGLLERIAVEKESELQYLEEMNAILEEFDGLSEAERQDPEKALFLAELDGIHKAEAEGDQEGAADRQEELLERFGKIAEEER